MQSSLAAQPLPDDTAVYPIPVSDIPLVFNTIYEQKADDSFINLIYFFRKNSQVHLQFTYENETLSLDWISRTKKNAKDKKKFLKLASSLNVKVVEDRVDGVERLRVLNDENLPRLVFPDGNGGYADLPREKMIAHLCIQSFKSIYGLSDSDTIFMQYEGLVIEKY